MRFIFTAADLPHTPKGYERAAVAVTTLYRGGEPVKATDVARRIGINPGSGNATKALLRAERTGLVRRIDRSRWIPLHENIETLN